MAYLVHIGFDSSTRLRNRVYYCEYNGIRFKLIQNNPRRYCDVLLSIIDNYDENSNEQVFTVASELVACMSWINNARMNVWCLGGGGFNNERSLRSAQCNIYSYPRTPFWGGIAGCSFSYIPDIENENQRKALLLYREAKSSNNSYLSVHFYWQAMEIDRNKQQTIQWIDDLFKTYPKYFQLQVGSYLDKLPVKANYGKYFREQCRNAISHIIPRRFQIESARENRRIAISNCVMEGMLKYYIMNDLQLAKRRVLVKSTKERFPVFVKENDLKQNTYEIAYGDNQAFPCKKKPWY